MNSLAIKNLAIACEALSRINGPRFNEQLTAVQALLDDEISKATMEKYTNIKPPRNTTAADDIPF